MLERAARSALDQDYGRIEVVVSDNDSADATEETLRRLATDDRLRYERQERNLGHARNFARVFEMADGELVMHERRIDLLSLSAAGRVLKYFSRVNVNGPMYGVMRREQLARVPFRELLAGDWLLVGAMAAVRGAFSRSTRRTSTAR